MRNQILGLTPVVNLWGAVIAIALTRIARGIERLSGSKEETHG